MASILPTFRIQVVRIVHVEIRTIYLRALGNVDAEHSMASMQGTGP